MEKSLFNLYELATLYMSSQEINPLNVIDKASDIYVEYSEQLTEPIQRVCSDCRLYINKDFEHDLSIEEYIALGEDLIETISGVLGEYFE